MGYSESFHLGWPLQLCFHFLPHSALTRQVCRRTEPIPSFQGRPDRNPAKINSPFLQRSADSESPGEKTSKEKSWKGNILPHVHHLTCLQHPEEPGQGYSPLCHHCQPRRAEEWCRACLLLLPLACCEQQWAVPRGRISNPALPKFPLSRTQPVPPSSRPWKGRETCTFKLSAQLIMYGSGAREACISTGVNFIPL